MYASNSLFVDKIQDNHLVEINLDNDGTTYKKNVNVDKNEFYFKYLTTTDRTQR